MNVLKKYCTYDSKACNDGQSNLKQHLLIYYLHKGMNRSYELLICNSYQSLNGSKPIRTVDLAAGNSFQDCFDSNSPLTSSQDLPAALKPSSFIRQIKHIATNKRGFEPPTCTAQYYTIQIAPGNYHFTSTCTIAYYCHIPGSNAIDLLVHMNTVGLEPTVYSLRVRSQINGTRCSIPLLLTARMQL